MSTSFHPDEFTHTKSETEPKEPREQDDHANAQDDAPPLGKRYAGGLGRRLMLHHAGTGTPAVVIEAGAGAFGLDYLNLFELCAKRTTCVLYDRAGSGWSDPVPEEGDESVVQAMLSELRRNPDIAREWYPTLFAEWEKLPAQVRDPLIARHMDPDRAIIGLRDMQSARRVQEEVTNGPALPDVPVTVLTGMQIDPMPGTSDEDQHAFNQIKLKAHTAFVSSVPQGEHRVLQDAGHLFYTQRPDVVARAVFDILDRIARSSRHR